MYSIDAHTKLKKTRQEGLFYEWSIHSYRKSSYFTYTHGYNNNLLK